MKRSLVLFSFSTIYGLVTGLAVVMRLITLYPDYINFINSRMASLLSITSMISVLILGNYIKDWYGYHLLATDNIKVRLSSGFYRCYIFIMILNFVDLLAVILTDLFVKNFSYRQQFGDPGNSAVLVFFSLTACINGFLAYSDSKLEKFATQE